MTWTPSRPGRPVRGRPSVLAFPWQEETRVQGRPTLQTRAGCPRAGLALTSRLFLYSSRRIFYVSVYDQFAKGSFSCVPKNTGTTQDTVLSLRRHQECYNIGVSLLVQRSHCNITKSLSAIRGRSAGWPHVAPAGRVQLQTSRPGSKELK